MNDVLKRLHILVGLFNLTAIVVFAATGIGETFPRREVTHETRLADYDAPNGLDDQRLADHVVSALQLPLMVPLPRGSVHRNADNDLEFDFYSTNGGGRVTVLESQRKARIELRRISLRRFITEAHATTLMGSGQVLTVRLWAFYIDCSIFSLLFMSVTGPWLWLVSRPNLWWARWAFRGGVILFAALWIVTR